MDKQNQTNLTKPTSRQIIRNILIIMSIPLLFHAAKFWVTNKCSVIDCKPANWNKVKEVVVQNTNSWGTDYKLSYAPISINYLNSKGLTKNDLMQKAEIRVYYVGRSMEFDDNNLWIDRRKSSIFSSLPSEDVMERFERVSIGYRDIYNLTWEKADETLNYPIKMVSIHLALKDEMQNEFDAESIWFILYADTEGNSIAYWVDAQTGKIVFTR